MKKVVLAMAGLVGVMACNEPKVDMAIQNKVDEYAVVEVKSSLYDALSENDKKIVELLRKSADIVDGLFWKQTFGDKSLMEGIEDPAMREFAMINYGPWDRMDDNASFVPGYGEKPDVCQYYPEDITKEEFDAFEDSNKTSLYTLIKRGEDGKLKSVWYKDEYKAELDKVCAYLEEAAALTDNVGLKNYLTERVKAFRTDDYFASDMAWMDMKDSKIDVVIGPIENYDDMFQSAKAAYECFILIKDEKRSADLAKYVALLPQLQKELPCAPEYKTFVPGTSSDLNVYDAIYYAGDCNAAGKTIAINLPNDDRVQAAKGARRLQLQNSITAKFDKIMMPIGNILIDPAQRKYLSADAFFWNITFHEVAHGLGVKETVNGKGSVDQAMGTQRTIWEEGKADILGLYLVNKLIDMGEISGVTKEDAITTYIAGIFRSVRFGAASSHGRANMMCFNFFAQKGAFTRSADGFYTVDYNKAYDAVADWASIVIKTQATGDLDFAIDFAAKNEVIGTDLAADLVRVNEAGIPKDIVFDFAW